MKLGFDKSTIEINKLVLWMLLIDKLIFLLDYECLRIYEKCPGKNIPMIYDNNIKYNNNKYSNNKTIM